MRDHERGGEDARTDLTGSASGTGSRCSPRSLIEAPSADGKLVERVVSVAFDRLRRLPGHRYRELLRTTARRASQGRGEGRRCYGPRAREWGLRQTFQFAPLRLRLSRSSGNRADRGRGTGVSVHGAGGTRDRALNKLKADELQERGWKRSKRTSTGFLRMRASGDRKQILATSADTIRSSRTTSATPGSTVV